MEPEEQEFYITRKFGCTHISWNIENYFFITHRKTWEIYSPPFNVNGAYFTKWRFILTATKHDVSGRCRAKIYLERLHSDGFTDRVRVFWKLWHPRVRYSETICENESVFGWKNCSRIPSEVWNLMNLEGGLLEMSSSEKFCIEGVILVTSTKGNKIFQPSIDMGLETLSEEVCALFRVADYHDLIINFGKKSIKCHKAILSVRNKKLQEAIDENSGESEIKLDWRGNSSLDQIFCYLYSGNLEHVLGKPSTCIDEDIDYFGIKALEAYYEKDKFTLSTIFEVREFSSKWVIIDIDSKYGYISSPNFRNEYLNITFRIRLEMNSEFVESGEKWQSEYIGIFLEIVEGSVPDEMYIKYDILDIVGNSAIMKGMRWSSEEGGNLGIQNFVCRRILKEPSIVRDGELCILWTLLIPTGKSDRHATNSTLRFLSTLNHEEHYLLLSKQIAKLFETGNHSDFTVQCKQTYFKVHKCILSARSSVFADIIRGLDGSRNEFSIPDFEPNTIRILLDYVYSGILKNYDLSDVLQIYTAGNRFGMKSLRNQCSEILQDNLQTLNVLDMLPLANTCKDLLLKIESFNFIMHNSKELCRQEKWRTLMVNSSLYEEFKDYVRNYRRCNPGEALEFDEYFETALKLNEFCQDEPM